MTGLLSGGPGYQPPNLRGTAFDVNVSADAQSAAERSGVDLAGLVVASANRALALLPHRGPMVITVTFGGVRQTIPEIGIAGYTDPRRGNVDITIDPEHARFGQLLRRWIPATVAHELDHSSRLRTAPARPHAGPGIGQRGPR